jgi:large subunit ribosomal protein L31
MKSDTHPAYYPVIFKDGEHEFITSSTRKSGVTRDIDGVEHYVIETALSAATHPFWTGQTRIVDAAGRVERFNRKYKRS